MTKSKNNLRDNKEIFENTNEFIFKEYDALRKQIDQYTDALLKAERWNLTATAAVWSWLATTSKANLPTLIYWLPAIVTIILGLRCFGLHKNNMMTAKYIADIERTFNLPEGLGWENKLLSNRPFIFSIGGYLYWFVTFVANILVPLFYIPSL